MNIDMTSDYAADQLLWPNVVRAVGQALVFTPLSAVATAGIEPENAGSASALFNMMRNLGGAVGIAVLQTFLTKREQFHSNVLTQSVSLFEEATRARIDALTHYFLATASPTTPRRRTRPWSRSAASCASRPTSWPSATPSTCSAPRWSSRSPRPCC